MFAGHFGLAAIIKAKAPQAPLWAIMGATQLLDIVFVPMLLSGVESIDTVEEGYGGSLIHADYTHSLVSALLLALVAGLLAGRAWSRRTGVVVGSTVFSHWLLDLIVHRPDLPLLPGNWGNLPLMGFGLWQYPVVTMVLELGLVVAGAVMYWPSAVRRAELRDVAGRGKLAGVVMGGMLVLALVVDVAGVG